MDNLRMKDEKRFDEILTHLKKEKEKLENELESVTETKDATKKELKETQKRLLSS